MNEHINLPQGGKKRLVFTSGGSRAAKIAGITSFLLGLGIFGAAFTRSGDLAENPAPGYVMGVLWAAAGAGIFFYRSEKRFDCIRRRWKVHRTFCGFGSKREGAFDELSEVEVDCYVTVIEPGSKESGPYAYEVRVTVNDGEDISIRRGIRHAYQALSIAADLSRTLSLRLKNRAVGKDNIIEMIPPENAPEPSSRMSISTREADTVTFIVPSGLRLETKYRISMGFTLACVTAPLLGISLFAGFIFWDWFAGWLRTGKTGELINALIATPFILLPVAAAYAVFVRTFMARETLQAGPSGVTFRRMHGSWSREKRIPRSRITAVMTRMNTFGRARYIEDIIIYAGADTIQFGHGLPDQEKIWIASRLLQILGIE